MKAKTSLNGHTILEIIISLVLILLVFLFFSYSFSNIHHSYVGAAEIEAVYKINLPDNELAVQEAGWKYISGEVATYYESGLKFNRIQLKSKQHFRQFGLVYSRYLYGEQQVKH